MANFEVPPEILQPYLPPGTQLDTYHGKHFVSIVGFLFDNTRIFGLKALFHERFEELNLRFYVTYTEEGKVKRGTVFISEIVPKPLIPLISNTFYNENYSCLKMKHSLSNGEEPVFVRYDWKSQSGWNYIQVKASNLPYLPETSSLESFITEHYWGYNTLNKNTIIEYGVEHPRWEVYPVKSCNFTIYTKDLYGIEFEPYLKKNPFSVFLVRGSDVLVRTPLKKTIYF
jgi:uncharacterized protein YqjF (DUF2071 family)